MSLLHGKQAMQTFHASMPSLVDDALQRPSGVRTPDQASRT